VTAGVYGEVLADGSHIVLAVSGDDYELDRAAAALRKMTMTCEPTVPKGMLTCPLTWAAVCQLGHTFNGGSIGQWMPGPRLRDWTLAELLRRTADPAKTAEKPLPAASEVLPAVEFEPAAEPHETAMVEQPAASTRKTAVNVLTPRPYQSEGAAMIGAGGKFLLFDDPGCGKTVTAILGLKARRERGREIFPMVIIVPSWDVGDVWARHVRTWAPEWQQEAGGVMTVMYAGPDRQQLLGDDNGIFITTYATARLDAATAKGPLARLRAETVIADEAHAVKNQDSKQSHAVRRIAAHAGTFIGITGTPVTRDTADVYPLLAAMDPPSWPSREKMVKRYCMTEEDGYGEKVQGLAPLAEPEFRAILLGQYRRVAKADVLSQLPPKVYSVRRVDIPPGWRSAYDGMAAEMLAELPDGEEVQVMSVLAQLTRLGQLASSACDVEVTLEADPVTGEEKKRYDVTLRAPSWKADALLVILAERPGQHVVVFTVSRQLAVIAGQACEQAGHRTGYILGGQAKGARKDAIDAFQAGKLGVIIATAGAGSLGITLTAAGTAVFLQRSWQLDQAIQAEDRLHRIGQRNDCVEIIDVIARDTVDDRVRELLRVKGGQLADLVRDARIARELLGGIR